MSKYDPLKRRLLSAKGVSLVLSFKEIEEITGQDLPKSAHEYDEWWSNEDPDKTAHVQSKAWTTAGFDAEVNLGRGQVTFRRR